MLGPKKIFVQKNVGFKMILSRKKIWAIGNFGSQKILGSEKMLGPNKINFRMVV